MVLTNRSYEINISLSLARDRIDVGRIQMYLRKLKHAIRGLYPSMPFYDEEVIETEGTQVAYMSQPN